MEKTPVPQEPAAEVKPAPKRRGRPPKKRPVEEAAPAVETAPAAAPAPAVENTPVEPPAPVADPAPAAENTPTEPPAQPMTRRERERGERREFRRDNNGGNGRKWQTRRENETGVPGGSRQRRNNAEGRRVEPRFGDGPQPAPLYNTPHPDYRDAMEHNDCEDVHIEMTERRPRRPQRPEGLPDDAVLDTDCREEQNRGGNEAVNAPAFNITDLQLKSMSELQQMGSQYGIEGLGALDKSSLIFEILRRSSEKTGRMYGSGYLEVLPDGFGFLRSPASSYLPGQEDVYLSPSQIKRFSLRTGDFIIGQIRQPREKERFFAMLKVESVNHCDPMHKREIMRLYGKVKQDGYALIPLSVYLKGSLVAEVHYLILVEENLPLVDERAYLRVVHALEIDGSSVLIVESSICRKCLYFGKALVIEGDGKVLLRTVEDYISGLESLETCDSLE